MRALTVSASAKYSVRWEWCTPPTIRRQRGALRFRLPPMTAASGSGLSRAKCRMKTPACWAAWRDMPACSRPRKIWQLLLTFFCREERPLVRSGDSGALHSPGNFAASALPGHWAGTRLPRPRSQESISPPFLWASGIYGHVAVDRSRAPAFHHPAHQPDLARLQQQSDQTCATRVSRCSNGSAGSRESC